MWQICDIDDAVMLADMWQRCDRDDAVMWQGRGRDVTEMTL